MICRGYISELASRESFNKQTLLKSSQSNAIKMKIFIAKESFIQRVQNKIKITVSVIQLLQYFHFFFLLNIAGIHNSSRDGLAYQPQITSNCMPIAQYQPPANGSLVVQPHRYNDMYKIASLKINYMREAFVCSLMHMGPVFSKKVENHRQMGEQLSNLRIIIFLCDR